jgi:hypothetical protein
MYSQYSNNMIIKIKINFTEAIRRKLTTVFNLPRAFSTTKSFTLWNMPFYECYSLPMGRAFLTPYFPVPFPSHQRMKTSDKHCEGHSPGAQAQ